MAECPLKKSVVEKDPDKIRLKCSLANATVDNNVDGSEESKAHDCEMSKRVGQEEVGVTKTEEELQRLSDSNFQSLLQEASQPLFDRNSEKSKLLRKVIDETNFKDSPCQPFLGRSWGCRRDGGGGRKSDRRTRLDSCGHGGSSAAACTTQGGSLQNLHGKPESKKLHKSGSLITFPAGSGIGAETCSELEALKLFLTSTVTATTLPRRNSGQSTIGSIPAAIRAKGASASAVTSEPLCDGVGAETVASTLSDPSRECPIGQVTHPMAENDCDTGLTHKELKIFERGRPTLDQKSFSKSTEEEEEEEEEGDAEAVVEEIEMMDIDRCNDDLDSETLPLLKNGPSTASAGGSQSSDWITSRPYGSMDGFRSKPIKSLEVDTSVSMPLSLKSSQSSSYMPPKGNFNNYGLVDSKGEHKLGVMFNERRKFENEGKSTSISRHLDENGNPRNTVICYSQDLQHRDADRDVRSTQESGSTDSNLKIQRKKKGKACKQVDFNPSALPGYFGGMPIEDILKRINSTEDLADEKLNVSIDSRKKGSQKDKDNFKTSGTKLKKIAPNRDVNKKNLENDMSRLNGSKENIIGHGLKEVLLDSIRDNDSPITLKSTFEGDVNKPNDQIAMDKSLKPKNDELSHQLRDYVENNLVRLTKPNAEILVEAFPLSTYFDMKEDGASKYPDSQELTNHVNSEDDTTGQYAEEKPTSVQPVSSFAVDFYSNPEAQLVLEDSEFCEVKKKKKNKPRSTKSEVCGGAHYKNYYYASSGGDGSTYSGSSGSSVVNEDGRRAQPASWANLSNLPHHYRNQRGSEDVRRKSTSSVPHSEHSSADNSDVESVHSLPVSSTTPKTVISKTSSSSSCTPQASYADIAKMATTAKSSSRRPLTGSTSPFKADGVQFLDLGGSGCPSVPSEADREAPLPAETKRDASTSTVEGCEVASTKAPLLSLPSPSDQCNKCEPPACVIAADGAKLGDCLSRSDQNGDINKGVLDFINSESLRAENLPRASLPAVPTDNAVSISTIEASSRGYSAVAPSQGINQGVSVVRSGATVTSTSNVVNEPFEETAVRVVESSLSSWGDVLGAGFKPSVVFVGALDVPVEELSEVTFGFEVNEELLRMTAAHWQGAQRQNQQQQVTACSSRTETQAPSCSPLLEEDMAVYHFTSSSDDAAVMAANAPAEAGLDKEEFGATEESREAKSPQDIYTEDTQYFNYQNVVDFIGRAWDGVQEELEKELQGGSSTRRAKVQYYSRTE